MLLRILDKLFSKKPDEKGSEEQSDQNKKGSGAPPTTFTHKCSNCGQCKK